MKEEKGNGRRSVLKHRDDFFPFYIIRCCLILQQRANLIVHKLMAFTDQEIDKMGLWLVKSVHSFPRPGPATVISTLISIHLCDRKG